MQAFCFGKSVSSALRPFARATYATAPGITKVGIVGMGLMGHGVAQQAAESGYQVVAVDISAEQLDKGLKAIESSLSKAAAKAVKKGKLDAAAAEAQVSQTRARITSAGEVGALTDCDLVVEAIVENLEIKKKFWADLGPKCKPGAILASNTSSFPIAEMGSVSGRGENFVGLHFFNPVQVMKLCEVIRIPTTSDSAFTSATDFVKTIGKEPVVCGDTPGFIVNRLLVPFLAQGLLMLERGVATVPDIDTAMKYGAGMPMGPFTLADYVGLDTCLSILQGWVAAHPNEPAFCIPASLEQKVREGKLGRKSGEGYWVWDGEMPVKPSQ